MGVPGKIYWKYSVKCLCVKPVGTLLELEKRVNSRADKRGEKKKEPSQSKRFLTGFVWLKASCILTRWITIE